MRHLDLSYEGRQLAERNQSNNGKLPHGGHRGSHRFPPCHLSYDKGREFQHKVQEEIDRLLEDNEIALKGSSPSWALLVSREPSYTDESPLITNSFMAASKFSPSNGISLHNRFSLLPTKKKLTRPTKRRDLQYYRPNSTHQYLSATELKNCSEDEVNLQYGRPTRTTLLRARQRCNSAPMNNYDKKRETDQRFEDFRTTHSVPSNTEYLELDKDGETLHSYLTGARYNRAHCLDSRSVDHTGVYMPRHNPALGCFFTGPKGHEYLKEFEDSPRSDAPVPPSPPRLRRRPTTAPSQGRRPVTRHPLARSAWTDLSSPVGHGHRSRHKQTRLNIVGCRLPIGGGLNRDNMALKLPLLEGRSLMSPRRHPMTSEETYRAFQPPPTPTSIPQPSAGKPEPEIIDNLPQGGEFLIAETMSSSVNVPTVAELDENAENVREEEAAFAAATVAAAIEAAVKEVSSSKSQPKESERIEHLTAKEEGAPLEEEIGNDGTNLEQKVAEEMSEEDALHGNNINEDIDGDSSHMQTDKPAVRGVRFFITEKTQEKKGVDEEKGLDEGEIEGEIIEQDIGNNETNETELEYEKSLEKEEEQFEEEKEEEHNIEDELDTEILTSEEVEDTAADDIERDESVDEGLLETKETEEDSVQILEGDNEFEKPVEQLTAPEIQITDADEGEHDEINDSEQ